MSMTESDKKTHKKPNTRREVAILGIGFVAFISWWAWAHPVEPVAEVPSISAPLPVVYPVPVASKAVPVVLTAAGGVHAWQNATISAQIGGLPVKEVLVDVGDKVVAGQLLAKLLDDTIEIEVRQQEANLAEAKAAMAEASANAQRTRKLAKLAAASEQELLEANTKEASATAKVSAAEAALSYQALRLAKTSIRAPHSGTISYRNVTAGQVVTSGTELFRYIQGDRIEWRAELNAENILKVKPGQAVTITMPDHKKVSGVVQKISPTLNESSRSGLAYVKVSPDPRAKPGMYLQGEIVVGSREATTIPVDAVHSDDKGSYLFLMGDDMVLQKRYVELSPLQKGDIELVSEIPEGYVVVASREVELAPNLQVTLAEDIE